MSNVRDLNLFEFYLVFVELRVSVSLTLHQVALLLTVIVTGLFIEKTLSYSRKLSWFVYLDVPLELGTAPVEIILGLDEGIILGLDKGIVEAGYLEVSRRILHAKTYS